LKTDHHFIPVKSDLFFKSQKTGDPRMGEISLSFSEENLTPGSYVMAGYPDDEGIRLNSGRPGASQGPDAIRSRFYKTSSSEFHNPQNQILDLGNIDTQLSLEERHQQGALACQQVLKKKGRWIGLGGGHDYGYSDGLGFLKANQDSSLKPLVMNFDAHLDVRPLDQGLSSGTPFFRLLTEESVADFDFYEIGIQRQCNSQSHIQWAKEKGAQILFYEDMMMSGKNPTTYLLEELAEVMVRPRPTFISVDIDCFSTSYAMGCSQAWPTGFSPEVLFPLLNILYARLDVQALGIYEVSPPLDLDERTVKLASQILHQFTGVPR
jgi:formiminoglutamase